MLRLPNELLVLITALIESRGDLYSWMRVCRRLHTLAEHLLYDTVLLRDIQDSASFDNSLCSHPERALQVRSLALHFATEEDFEPVSIIPRLASMANLQKLSVDSPDEEIVAFDEVINLALVPAPMAVLPSLRECTLRYWDENGGLWNLANKDGIFMHPTLQCLTIIYAQAEELAMSDLRSYNSSTALQELNLLQSDIHASSLASMLGVPKALKRLTITQDISAYPPRAHSPVDLNDYVHAMTPQYSSLESLTVVQDAEWFVSDLLLENLLVLRHLEIAPARMFGRIDTFGHMVATGARLAHIMPRDLCELQWLDMRQSTFMSYYMLLLIIFDVKTAAQHCTKLRRVTLHLADKIRPPQLLFEKAEATNVEIVIMKDGVRVEEYDLKLFKNPDHMRHPGEL